MGISQGHNLDFMTLIFNLPKNGVEVIIRLKGSFKFGRHAVKSLYYQFTRAMINRIFWFWVFIWLLFFIIREIWQILGVLGLILLAWLTDHLIDEARLNNEKYDD